MIASRVLSDNVAYSVGNSRLDLDSNFSPRYSHIPYRRGRRHFSFDSFESSVKIGTRMTARTLLITLGLCIALTSSVVAQPRTQLPTRIPQTDASLLQIPGPNPSYPSGGT